MISIRRSALRAGGKRRGALRLEVRLALAIAGGLALLAALPLAASAASLPAPADPPGWLGISLEDAPAEGSEAVRALVKLVFRDSPADAAGFERGDVVVSIGGHPITNGIKELVAHVKSNPIDATVRFEVKRGGASRTLEAKLGAVPERGSLTEREWKGQPLPTLALRDVASDEPIDMTAFRGEVVVLDVWTTWCGPCRGSMPKIEALQKRLADRGLRVVGVSNEEREVVKRFTDNRGLAFRSLAYDPDQSVASELYVSSYPTYLVIDPQGTIREVFRGTGRFDEMVALVESLLPE